MPVPHTGKTCCFYVCLATTLTIKSKAAIVTAAMSLQIVGRLDGCPDCGSIRFREKSWYSHCVRVCMCCECHSEYGRHTDRDTVEAYTDE